jgi:sec-independent protein translocase protein TatC
VERIDDVRRRLIWSAVTVALGAGLGFVLAMNYDLLGVLIGPVKPFLHGTKLKYLSPTEPFFITIKLGILVGVVLALPVIMHHVWCIVRPLLGPREPPIVRPMLAMSIVLFLAGAVFCFVAVVPLMLRFTMGFQTESLEQNIVIGEYLSIVLRMVLAFGVVFEMPVVALVGTLLGIVDPEFFASKRRHAILLSVVLGALLTPPDVASQVLMAVPMYALFEISILVSRLAVRRTRATVPLEV